MEGDSKMAGCPDSECHNTVRGHTTTLFGKDGLHGIAGANGSLNKLNEKIDGVASCTRRKTSNIRFYMTLGITISCIAGFLSPFLIKAMDAWSLEKQLNHDNKNSIAMEKKVNESIQRDVSEIKQSLTQMRKERMSLVVEVKKAVKEAIKEVHNDKK